MNNQTHYYTNYHKVHQWIKKNYGNADHCSSDKCEKKSTKFEWAKLKGKNYEFNRDNFIQLCVSCHRRYDLEGVDKKISIALRRSVPVIRDLRLKLLLEKSEIAKILDIHTDCYSRIEMGITKPKLSVIRKLRDIAKQNSIEFPVEYFLDNQ